MTGIAGDAPYQPLKHVEELKARLAQIQAEAENYEDGAPDATGIERAMNRIVGICRGERVI